MYAYVYLCMYKSIYIYKTNKKYIYNIILYIYIYYTIYIYIYIYRIGPQALCTTLHLNPMTSSARANKHGYHQTLRHCPSDETPASFMDLFFNSRPPACSPVRPLSCSPDGRPCPASAAAIDSQCCSYTNTHTDTHTRTHICTQIHTHKLTHTHTYTRTKSVHPL